MENTNPKEILENIISVMEKTHVDDWEIDKLVVVLNYINELESKINKTIEYIEYALNNPLIDDREALKIALEKIRGENDE